MKDIEKLKKEQVELKEKLQALIDFINSEEYFTITDAEKSLLATQRAGMEMYLNALTNRIYANLEGPAFSFSSSTLLPMMMSMLSMPSFGSSSVPVDLQKLAEENKEKDRAEMKEES